MTYGDRRRIRGPGNVIDNVLDISFNAVNTGGSISDDDHIPNIGDKWQRDKHWLLLNNLLDNLKLDEFGLIKEEIGLLVTEPRLSTNARRVLNGDEIAGRRGKLGDQTVVQDGLINALLNGCQEGILGFSAEQMGLDERLSSCIGALHGGERVCLGDFHVGVLKNVVVLSSLGRRSSVLNIVWAGWNGTMTILHHEFIGGC